MRGGGRGLWASSLWGVFLNLARLSPNRVGSPELGVRPEPANRLRAVKKPVPPEKLEQVIRTTAERRHVPVMASEEPAEGWEQDQAGMDQSS